MPPKEKTAYFKKRSLLNIYVLDEYHKNQKPQASLAKELGLSESTISRIIHGRNEKSRI